MTGGMAFRHTTKRAPRTKGNATIKKDIKLANKPKGQLGLKIEKLEIRTNPSIPAYPIPPALTAGRKRLDI